MGINIEVVSPQNEPGYDQNYPSCLWDSADLRELHQELPGPGHEALNVKVMLGTMSNAGDGDRNDINIATAVLADATAKSFVSVAGVQWGVLERVNGGQTFGGLPIWATEHKCGNYPWNPSTGCGETSSPCPAYNMIDGPQRPRLRGGELDLPPKRDQQGQGHGLQRLEHGARPERPGQRHCHVTGDRTPSW